LKFERLFGGPQLPDLFDAAFSLQLFNDLPFLPQDFVDYFDEFLRVQVLERIEVPARFPRELVGSFTPSRHKSSV